MVASRRLNVSSAPRFFSKLLARNIAITAGTAGVESRAVNGAVISVAMMSSYESTANWSNAILPFSQLRYNVLRILNGLGIPRSLSYVFMAEAQHAYKQLVLKNASSIDEVYARFVTAVLGNTPQQARFFSVSQETLLNAIDQILAYLGLTLPSASVESV